MPPGQYVTDDFPVLSAGPTPHTPLDEWTFEIRGGARAVELDVGRVPRAAERDGHRRHPLRDEVVQARHGLGRRLGRHAAGAASSTAARVLLAFSTAATRRTSRSRTCSTGRPGSRTTTTASRSTPSTAARPGCSCRTCTSGRARSGCAASSSATRTSPASGSVRLPHLRRPVAGTAVLGRLTWQVAAGRRSHDRRRRASGRSLSTLPELAGPPCRPARRRPADGGGRLPGQRSYSIASAPEHGARADRRAARRRRGLALPGGRATGPATSSSCAGRSAATSSGRPTMPRPLLLVAGGSGVVPLMAMLRHRSATGGRRRRCGCSTRRARSRT